MADNWIQSFAVALGFDVDKSSFNEGKKTLADYEAAVKAAQKRIDDALWAGAKTEEQIAKLTRETALKEAKQALADAQDREKTEKEAGKKRQERAKDFIAGVEKMALAATAAATAIGYAVTRVAGAFDHLGFVSARTGASVQSLNSLGYAFKQTGGTAEQAISAVESFTKAMRENSGVKGFVAGLGVDMDKDKVDQLLDTVRILQTHGYDSGSREAALAGISEENYALLTKYIDQIDRYRAEYDSLTKSLGVNSKEATDASTAFQRSLTRLQATASALGDKLIISLAPAIQRIVDRFQDWIRSNPEKVEHIMDGISKALVWVTEKIAAMVESVAGNNGDEFIKRWDAFTASVDRFSTALERLIKMSDAAGNSELFKILKFLTVDNPLATWPSRLLLSSAEASTGTPGVVVTPGTRQGPMEDKRSTWERYAPTILGGKPDPNEPTEARGGIRARAARAMRSDQSGGVAANPGAYKDVLDHIARSEGTASQPGGGYNTSLGYGRYLPGGKEQNLTSMTLDQILALGNSMRRQPGNPNSSALGRYQIVGDTLRVQMRKLGLKGSDLFDENTQDRIAANLARQRGADPVGLRQEWASLVGAKNATAVALMQKVDPKASIMPTGQPAVVDRRPIIVPIAPASTMRGLPTMNPGGFDPNNINPSSLMPIAPAGASPTVNNSTSNSSSNKAVHQTFNNNTTIHEARNAREAGRMMTGVFDQMHGLALENAQTAIT